MRTILLTPVLLSLFALGCAQEGLPSEGEQIESDESAIINGSPDVTHTAVVAVLGPDFECTGTVLQVKGTTGYVLTAAHCCPANDLPVQVVIGPNYFTGASHEVVTGSVVADPCYQDYAGSTDDVCMLKFKNAAGVPTIPAMTPQTDNLVTGTSITYIGYGLTAAPQRQQQPASLRHQDGRQPRPLLRRVRQRQCQRHLRGRQRRPRDRGGQWPGAGRLGDILRRPELQPARLQHPHLGGLRRLHRSLPGGPDPQPHLPRRDGLQRLQPGRHAEREMHQPHQGLHPGRPVQRPRAVLSELHHDGLCQHVQHPAHRRPDEIRRHRELHLQRRLRVGLQRLHHVHRAEVRAQEHRHRRYLHELCRDDLLRRSVGVPGRHHLPEVLRDEPPAACAANANAAAYYACAETKCGCAIDDPGANGTTTTAASTAAATTGSGETTTTTGGAGGGATATVGAGGSSATTAEPAARAAAAAAAAAGTPRPEAARAPPRTAAGRPRPLSRRSRSASSGWSRARRRGR